jgi:hypothetical protein
MSKASAISNSFGVEHVLRLAPLKRLASKSTSFEQKAENPVDHGDLTAD